MVSWEKTTRYATFKDKPINKQTLGLAFGLGLVVDFLGAGVFFLKRKQVKKIGSPLVGRLFVAGLTK